ncbi:hypothetical protein GIB67_042630 [Kingdonia uniflora]|uniref:Aminotransferase-like plant mobile domain-containing protein n=1 Tax=Kingdonia uniflora TaxID=39325 RepID=A0A7J7M1D0_9MAGN|nr:hypothetical protein GIB67_042630 [Kingdonia uniflora]
MNEKVPSTASNKRKRELAREGDLVTYKRKRKTIDRNTVVLLNTVDSANEGISEGVNISTESTEGVNIPQGSEFEIESAQAGLGAQPPLPNVYLDFDENIPIFGGYSESEGATRNDDVGPSDKSLLWSFRFHRARSIALGQGTDVSARYLVLFSKDKVAKKWSWGSTVLAHMYYNLGATSRDDARQFPCCTTLLESWIFAHFPKLGGIPKDMDFDAYEHCTCWKCDVSVTDRYRDDSRIHQRKPASVNEHGDTPVHQSEDIAEQYDASHHEHSSLSPNINLNDQQITTLNDQLQKLREDKEKESEANRNLREALKEKYKAIESLKAVNTILMEQIDMQLLPATPPVPNTTLRKKYEDLLAAHEDVKKKLIAKEDFEVWRQTLKKALASEGMRDMGDLTFEELFEQNERFFTIAQQGPNGDYQEYLVSTAVTLESVVIARKEKMTKKKKMQELLFQPWTKYLVDVRGVEISDNNSGFRVYRRDSAPEPT